MGQQFLIDSNVVFDYLNGKLSPAGMAFMDDVADAIPNVSVITRIEVLGYNHPENTYNQLLGFISESIIFDLNEEIILKTISLRKVRKIKTPDAIIAATAQAYNLTLITRNTKDFANIKGLKILNPHETP